MSEDVRRRVQVIFPSKGRTKQSFKAQCDINSIVDRYNKTGLLTHINASPGQSGDFTSATDFHSALNLVHAAQDRFMALPSKVRSYFRNDPGLFLKFMSDPKNLDKAVELGLARRPTPPPPPAPPAPPAPPVPPAPKDPPKP